MADGDAAAGAFVDHAVQLALELAQQQDAPADLFAVATGHGVDVGEGAVSVRGEGDEFANRVDGEAEFPCVANEVQALAIGWGVAALAAGDSYSNAEPGSSSPLLRI